MQILPQGQYIRHSQYGLGVVSESDAQRTTVEFENFGKKKFDTGLMKAELVGEAPPKALRARRRRKAPAAAAPVEAAV